MTFSAHAREPFPAAVIASREAALAKAGAALAKALANSLAAQKAVATEGEAMEACKAELAALAHPGVDDDAIRAYRDRRETLTIKVEGYGPRLESAERSAKVCESEAEEARRALAKAESDFDAPAERSDTSADLPRLKTDLGKAASKAAAAKGSLARVEEEAAPALAAYATWLKTGADEAASLRIVKARNVARDNLAVAEGEVKRCDEAAAALLSRVEAIEGMEDRKRRSIGFATMLDRLTKRRELAATALKLFDQEGERIARLRRTCEVWPQKCDAVADRLAQFRFAANPPALMRAPRFAADAQIPMVTKRGWHLHPQWEDRHYAQLEPHPEFLTALGEFQSGDDLALRRLVTATAAGIAEAYEVSARRLLECLAIEFAWRRERDSYFAEAGDVAAASAKPVSALAEFAGIEAAPWKALSLPSLRNGGEPIWRADWSPERLLEVTRSVEAA